MARVVKLCEPWLVNDLVPDRLDEPWTRSAMAKQVGVAPTTLANWASRDQSPLGTIQAPNGDAMYTWRHLLDFCGANPNLHATRQVMEQYRVRLSADPLSRPPQQSSSARADAVTRSRPASAGAASGDGVTLRSALQNLNTQIDEHSAVVAAAVKLAEHAARVQQTLVASMARLEAAVTAVPGADG
jgi:hypothetical protein